MTFDSFHPFLIGKYNSETDKALWAIEHLYQWIRLHLQRVHTGCSHERQSDATGIRALSIPGQTTQQFYCYDSQTSRSTISPTLWRVFIEPGQIRYSWSVSFPFANIYLYTCRLLTISIINRKAVALVVLRNIHYLLF